MQIVCRNLTEISIEAKGNLSTPNTVAIKNKSTSVKKLYDVRANVLDLYLMDK